MPEINLRLRSVPILVRNQDEALEFYVEKLGFEKREDDAKSIPGYRWLTVSPKDQNLQIVLAKPGPPMHDEGTTKKLLEKVGRSSHQDEYAIWVFETADCESAFEELRSKGVESVQEPKKMLYGTMAIFKDIYGNQFVLRGPHRMKRDSNH